MTKPADELRSSSTEHAATALLTLRVPTRDWTCTVIRLTGEYQLDIQFERADSAERVEIRVVSDAGAARGQYRSNHCAVTSRASSNVLPPVQKYEVAAITAGIAAAVDERLAAAAPGASLAEALGRVKGTQRVVFGRDLLRQMLAPDLVEGTSFVDTWRLVGVYPATHVRRISESMLALVAELRHDSGARLLIHVERRDDGRPAFVRTSHFNLSYRAVGVEPASAPVARALVAFLLQLRDHDGLDLSFPDLLTDVASIPRLSAGRSDVAVDRWLNLSVLTECGQSCAFCSAKELAPPEQGIEAILARCFADLDDARSRGITQVRVNGYDPLAYPRILEVLERATQLGYERTWIYSPCTRLADRGFCEQVLSAAPKGMTFNVPLYAVDAATHDQVVGRAGAHAQVLRALGNLLELAGAASILLEVVVVRDNLRAIGPLVAFAEARGLPFSCHLPFPTSEAPTDRFFSSAARQTQVIEAAASLYLGERRFYVRGVAPCVAFRVLREAGVPPKRWLGRADMLPGTQYRDRKYEHGAGDLADDAAAAATVVCPHSQSCVLSSACGGELRFRDDTNAIAGTPGMRVGGELLRSYVELYGLDEFRPVELRELLEAT
ncbi:MAG TPA: hypothetical protein VG937_10375 [Polyangiaceae bacterium]|nr:hypothetical protein [Polyangiaceae bacterium]